MPRRVRRALLVALAALASCSLAGSDGSACTNSCHCHSSPCGLSVRVPTGDSSGSIALSPLLGAAPPPPSLHAQGQANNPLNCKKCLLTSAFYGPPENPMDVTSKLTPLWDWNQRSVKARCEELLIKQADGHEKACGAKRASVKSRKQRRQCCRSSGANS